MHCDTLKQDNDSTVRGDGGSRVGEVRAGTTSRMPEHKGFKLQLVVDIGLIVIHEADVRSKTRYTVFPRTNAPTLIISTIDVPSTRLTPSAQTRLII